MAATNLAARSAGLRAPPRVTPGLSQHSSYCCYGEGSGTRRIRELLPDEVTALEEPAAVEMAKKARQVSVAVPGRDKPVMTSCVSSPAPKGGEDVSPFVLTRLRQLVPRIPPPVPAADRARRGHAVDLLGWGFTDAGDAGIGDYSPEAKRAHLYAFWKQEIGRPITLVGVPEARPPSTLPRRIPSASRD